MKPSQEKMSSKKVCVGFFFFSSCTFNLFPSQVLQDCMRHHSSIVEIGKLWVSLSITVVLIYLCSYVCPIRTEEASSFNCAHQTLCPLFRATSMTDMDSSCPSIPSCCAQNWNFTQRYVPSLSYVAGQGLFPGC